MIISGTTYMPSIVKYAVGTQNIILQHIEPRMAIGNLLHCKAALPPINDNALRASKRKTTMIDAKNTNTASAKELSPIPQPSQFISRDTGITITAAIPKRPVIIRPIRNKKLPPIDSVTDRGISLYCQNF